MGFSHTHIGFLLGATSLAGIFGPLCFPRWQQVTQTYRLMPVLIPFISSIFLLLSWKINVYTVSLLLAVFFGFCFSSLQPVNDSMIIHSLDNPHKDYNFVRSFGPLGYLISSALLTIFPIINITSSQSIIQIISIANTMFLLLFFLIPKINQNKLEEISSSISNEVKKKHSIIHDIKSNPQVFYIMLVVLFLNSISIGIIISFVFLFAKEHFNMSNVTSISIVSAGAEIIVLQLGNKIISKAGYFNSLLLILGSSMFRLLMLAGAPHVAFIYLSQALHIGSFSLVIIMYIHFVNHHIPIQNKSFSTGMFWSFHAIATYIASSVGGIILGKTSFSTLFLVGTIPLILACVYVLNNRKHFQRYG